MFKKMYFINLQTLNNISDTGSSVASFYTSAAVALSSNLASLQTHTTHSSALQTSSHTFRVVCAVIVVQATVSLDTEEPTVHTAGRCSATWNSFRFRWEDDQQDNYLLNKLLAIEPAHSLVYQLLWLRGSSMLSADSCVSDWLSHSNTWISWISHVDTS